jgi:allophanate hydrolase
VTISFSIEGLEAAYDAGIHPSEVVQEMFRRIEASPDPAVWIALRPRDAVLRDVERLARDIRHHLPLWGIPFAVKDNIDAAGLATTAACPPLAYRPGADAAVVARLRAAGALLVGKTNLDQFATGLGGVRSPFGAPRCVFDPERASGGSSSGSAVAVARAQVAFALGTDTAGSGRVPAAFNHVVGVKPTRGLLSTRGVLPASRSLDCVSVFASSCADGDLVRRIAQGFDPSDPYSRPPRQRPLSLGGLSVGVLAEADRDLSGNAGAAALYDHAIEALGALGWDVRAIDYAPFRDAGRLLYGSALLAERLSGLEPLLERAPDAFDPTVRAILERARGFTAADAFRAEQARSALARRAEREWEKVDVLLLPTAPLVPRVDALLADPFDSNARLGTYTQFVNLLDCAAVAFPGGFLPDGLPFGLSLVSPAFCDDDLAVIADRLHRALEPTSGGERAPLPAAVPPGSAAADAVHLAVVGAHLSGQPLNDQLTRRGGVLVTRTRTSSCYRLYALAGTSPAKPGLFHDPDTDGPGIEVEVWALSLEAFGSFVADVPPPHAIGTLLLADGERVKGFLCEGMALAGAREITELGGWRAYLATRDAS